MLPFVVGGGILIAIAFLIDGLNVDINSLPADQRSNFGTITPMAALFKSIGGTAFGFMLPVLAGYIAMAIADRPALAVGFVGGMIAANGKSGFLGALVAGFVAGYLIIGLRKLCDKLPDALEKIAPVLIYPVVGILIIGIFMTYVVEPIMGGINTGVNSGLEGMAGSSKILLGLILGGMMSIDMGGPFNKAAYVFGVAQIAAGNYDIMAAVMIGGMVPPCAIALSYLSSFVSMNSVACAILAAFAISSSVASSLPNRRLDAIVPENNTPFCGTNPISSRKSDILILRMSLPSSVILPPVTS